MSGAITDVEYTAEQYAKCLLLDIVIHNRVGGPNAHKGCYCVWARGSYIKRTKDEWIADFHSIDSAIAGYISITQGGNK